MAARTASLGTPPNAAERGDAEAKAPEVVAHPGAEASGGGVPPGGRDEGRPDSGLRLVRPQRRAVGQEAAEPSGGGSHDYSLGEAARQLAAEQAPGTGRGAGAGPSAETGRVRRKEGTGPAGGQLAAKQAKLQPAVMPHVAALGALVGALARANDVDAALELYAQARARSLHPLTMVHSGSFGPLPT